MTGTIDLLLLLFPRSTLRHRLWIVAFLFLLFVNLSHGSQLSSVCRDINTLKRKEKTLSRSPLSPIVALRANRKEKVLKWIPDGMKNALSSGVATVLVKSILQPLDTIKTMQQIQEGQRKTLIATAREILLSRGVKGLWSGTLISALGSAPAAAVYYGVFSAVKRRLTPVLPLQYRFIAIASAATVSNTIASVFRVPYEVYKQRLQAGLHQTIWEAATHSWQKEGPLGLFQQGKLASQIIRDVPYAIITAVIYDALQVLMNRWRAKRREELGPGADVARVNQFYQVQDALCGAAAGGLSSFLTTPMDMVKTRLMTATHYHSFADALRRIAAEEGVASFFSGSASRVLHKIPANAMFFVFYEAIRFVVGAVEVRSEQ
eukprot:gene11657-12720_t